MKLIYTIYYVILGIKYFKMKYIRYFSTHRNI